MGILFFSLFKWGEKVMSITSSLQNCSQSVTNGFNGIKDSIGSAKTYLERPLFQNEKDIKRKEKFDSIDQGHKGYITLNEFRNAAANNSVESKFFRGVGSYTGDGDRAAMNHMFTQINEKHDGKVTLDEYNNYQDITDWFKEDEYRFE